MKKKTLSEYLVEHGMSQSDFAATIGMSQTSVWRMTKGLQLERRKTRNLILLQTNGEVDVWEGIIPEMLDSPRRRAAG